MNYSMCPTCRVADVEVQMAKDVRADCPHCGSVLMESLRICCIPDCNRALPVTRALPVCNSCGIKIATAHLHDAEMMEPIRAQQRRMAQEVEDRKRQGMTDSAVVYYVRLDAERIKIGFTSNLTSRLSGLRVPRSNLLAWEPGGRELERERHEQFRADRIRPRQEDFRPSEALLTWIDGLVRLNPLPNMPPDTNTVTVRKK